MFYHLEGVVTDIDINFAVIDCGGVGYGVNTTANTLSHLKINEGAKLYISECIKEDAFDLYGFYTLSEKRCFEMMLTVSGIGPKAAQSILSLNTPETLAMAVMNGDEKPITAAPGVGKKIAQRLILELKDKMSKQAGTAATELPYFAAQAQSGAKNEAVTALTVLGYSTSEINASLGTFDPSGMTTEQIVKLALKNLMK